MKACCEDLNYSKLFYRKEVNLINKTDVNEQDMNLQLSRAIFSNLVC